MCMEGSLRILYGWFCLLRCTTAMSGEVFLSDRKVQRKKSAEAGK